MTIKYLSLLMIAVLLLASCDEGRIGKEEYVAGVEGNTVEVIGTLSGIGNWASGYHVVIAGFNGTSDYPIVSKSLPVSGNDGDELTVTMGGITSEVNTIELCVINRLRQRVVTFASIQYSEDTDETITMDVGTMDVGMYSGIQQGIFNRTCVTCHGASAGSPAANLDLREGESYSYLVDVPSTVVEDCMRVASGSAEESILYQILTTDVSASWGIDHSQLVSTTVGKSLIEDWINNGAQP